MLTIIMLIFETIANLLIAVVKFVLSILNYFGLTIPVFYFLLMFILNLILGGVIFNDTLYSILFKVGLGLSFAAAIIYFISKFFIKKRRNPPRFEFKNKFKQRRQEENQQSPLIPSGNIIQERVFQDPNGNIVQERTFQLPENAKFKTYPLEQKPDNFNPAIKENTTVKEIAQNQKALLKPVDRFSEEPSIYRVKNNRQYIIKEYSDRVEVYKETERGYDFVKCDYK